MPPQGRRSPGKFSSSPLRPLPVSLRFLPKNASGVSGDPAILNMLGRNESALRQGFACGKTLVRRKSAAPSAMGPQRKRNSSFIRSKTDIFSSSPPHPPPACLRFLPKNASGVSGDPAFSNMLGRSKSALRQGFAYGKTLVRRKSAAPSVMGPQRKRRSSFIRSKTDIFSSSPLRPPPACLRFRR